MFYQMGKTFESVLMVKNMNMHKVLENFIARYFEKKLMPGIRKKYREMEEKYGASGAGDGELGKDYYVNSFGFQTEFMMRYMTIAFGIVCLFLVATAFRIGGDAWNGAGIFGVFFGICLILWGICRIRRGYIVYNTRWISVSRGGHWADETMDRLSGISVTGNLTLTFGIEKNMARKISIPLEGGQYMDFTRFLEKNFSQVIAAIPEKVYARAKRKHGSSWGNQM